MYAVKYFSVSYSINCDTNSKYYIGLLLKSLL